MDRLVKGCGLALMLGGGLLILINTTLTPMMLAIESDVEMRLSTVYLVRLSLAMLVALLFIFGCLGVHLAQRGVAGRFGVIAFLLAFLGNCLLFALEWANVFVLRPVARHSPDALAQLDEAALLNLGVGSAMGLFMLGWLLMAASALRAKVLSRVGAAMVMAGLLLIPALAITPLGMTGMIIGNVVFGLGLILMGRSAARVELL